MRVRERARALITQAAVVRDMPLDRFAHTFAGADWIGRLPHKDSCTPRRVCRSVSGVCWWRKGNHYRSCFCLFLAPSHILRYVLFFCCSLQPTRCSSATSLAKRERIFHAETKSSIQGGNFNYPVWGRTALRDLNKHILGLNFHICIVREKTCFLLSQLEYFHFLVKKIWKRKLNVEHWSSYALNSCKKNVSVRPATQTICYLSLQ